MTGGATSKTSDAINTFHSRARRSRDVVDGDGRGSGRLVRRQHETQRKLFQAVREGEQGRRGDRRQAQGSTILRNAVSSLWPSMRGRFLDVLGYPLPEEPWSSQMFCGRTKIDSAMMMPGACSRA